MALICICLALVLGYTIILIVYGWKHVCDQAFTRGEVVMTVATVTLAVLVLSPLLACCIYASQSDDIEALEEIEKIEDPREALAKPREFVDDIGLK